MDRVPLVGAAPRHERPAVVNAPAIDGKRLLADLEALAAVGDTGDGGNCRLALTDEDAGGRELVVGWMRDLGLSVRVDRIGNVVATRAGTDDTLDPVMTGSHIDTVRTGGRYDGTLGVLAGLEVVRALDDAGVRTRRPLAVAFFTDEEGSRFAPDMLGSLVYAGGLRLEDALDIVAIDGAVLGAELERIGWAGDAPVPGPAPHAYVELHIEQGPLLEEQGVTIGAVTGVQGISWQELTLTGQSNHAGTTPMRLRRDAGLAAAEVAVAVRHLATDLGGHQVGTVGRVDLHPNLVNVVAAKATLTVDLRNTDEAVLAASEQGLRARVDEIAAAEGVTARVALAGPVRSRRLRRGGDLAGRARRGRPRALGDAAALGRRPRRPDARPPVPERHGVRPQPGRRQPQPGRVHRARGPGGGVPGPGRRHGRAGIVTSTPRIRPGAARSAVRGETRCPVS